jgi:hypothetical protein
MKKERNQNVDIFPLLYAYWHIDDLLHAQLNNDGIDAKLTQEPY